MENKKLFIILIASLMTGLLVAGCGAGDAGMPNPASEFCEDNGGKIEIREGDDGQYGVCIFPDGSECDEWEYARGECKPASEDEEMGIANPASVFCEEQGGTLEIRDTEEGQLGYCLFDDGSECEEWAFFRGECAPGGAKFLPPTTASKDAQLGGLAIAETEVLIAESFPVQVTLHVSGDMPTPCHQLAVEIRPPDDDNVIMVVLSSWQEDNGLACAQVMTPFFSNITIPIDELAEGAYTVWVNGYEVGEFNLP